VRIKSEFREALVSTTVELHKYVDQHPEIRARLHEVFEDLVLAGTCIWRLDGGRGSRVFHLDEFVCRRNSEGGLIALCIKEPVMRAESEDRVRALIPNEQQTADLFTMLVKDEDGWEVFQEVCGKEVPGSRGRYTDATNPFIDCTFRHVSREHYGRSYVESLIGDLRTADGLSQAIVEGAAASARLIPLLSPTSVIKPAELARQRNGEPIVGETTDISFLTVGKAQDFGVAASVLDKVERRLELAFLMNTAVQRDAERVTAREIETMVNELNDSIGGLYSKLTSSIQAPLARRVLAIMRDEDLLADLPLEYVHIAVVAGLDNVGRGRDLQGIQAAVGTAANLVGIEQAAMYLNTRELLMRAFSDVGVDARGIIKTEEQLQQEQEAAQEQQMQLIAAQQQQTQPPQ
jgi:hypothetical protein